MAKKKKKTARFSEEDRMAILDAYDASDAPSVAAFIASDGRVTAATLGKWLSNRQALLDGGGEQGGDAESEDDSSATTALATVAANGRYGKRGRARSAPVAVHYGGSLKVGKRGELVSSYPQALVAGNGEGDDLLEGAEVVRLRKVNVALVKALKQAQAQILELAELA